MSSQGWRVISQCTKSEINLDILLNCGQSFRWKQKSEGEWIGVIGHHVWHLCQKTSGIHYKVFGQHPMSSKSKGINHCRLLKPQKNDEFYKDDKTEVKQEPVSLFENKKLTSRGTRKRGSHVKELHSSLAKHKKTADNLNIDIFSHSSRSCEEPGLSSSNSIKSEVIEDEQILQAIENLDSEINFPVEDCEIVFRDYFQLDVDLCKLYDHWSSRDTHFKQVAGSFQGIRMLRQDPTENLISFVCSSNNHISRITGMVQKLCIHYGEFITEIDGEKYFSFPPLSALTGNDVENHLRELGFGYRAKFISAIAQYISSEKDEDWLESLRMKSYQEAKAELITLMGVGAKVADCVCLMSLDKPEAVPVDTHVWQITVKNYMAKLQTAKSLTDKIYNEIGDFYRNLWGPYAGWAHSVLFTADLKHNKGKDSDSSTQTKNAKSGKKTASKSTKDTVTSNSVGKGKRQRKKVGQDS